MRRYLYGCVLACALFQGWAYESKYNAIPEGFVWNTEALRLDLEELPYPLRHAYRMDEGDVSYLEAGEASVPLTEGFHEFHIGVADSTGQWQGNLGYSFLIDRTAPRMLEASGSSSWLKEGVFHLSFKLTEPVQAQIGARVSVNGLEAQYSLKGDSLLVYGSFPHAYAGDGAFQFWWEGFADQAGNALQGLEAPLSWRVDTRGPLLEGAAIKAPELTADSMVLLEIAGFNGFADVALWRCLVDSLVYAEVALPQCRVRNREEGIHQALIYALDSAGNSSQALKAQWLVDFTSPHLKSISMASDTILAAGPIALNLTFDEAMKADSAMATLGGSPLKGRWLDSATLRLEGILDSATQEGEQYLRLGALRDLAGNQMKDSAWFRAKVDHTAPMLTEAKGSEGWLVPGDFQLDFKLSEPVFAQAGAYVRMNGLALQYRLRDGYLQARGTLPKDFPGDGAWVLEWQGFRDAAGNALLGLAKSTGWRVDTRAPALKGARIGVEERTNKAEVPLRLEAPEGLAGVSRLRWIIDGQELAQCTPTLVLNALGEGWHRAQVNALDSAGNSSEGIYAEWLVDRTPPHAHLNGLPMDTALRAGKVSFQVVYDEAMHAGPALVEFGNHRWKGVWLDSVTLGVEGVLDSASLEGWHRLRVLGVVDRAGNGADTNALGRAMVDRTAPEGMAGKLGWNGLVQGVAHGETITVNFGTLSDASGLKAIRVALDEDSLAAIPSVRWVSPALTEGAHWLKWQIEDGAGNKSALESMSFVVDRTAPRLVGFKSSCAAACSYGKHSMELEFSEPMGRNAPVQASIGSHLLPGISWKDSLRLRVDLQVDSSWKSVKAPLALKGLMDAHGLPLQALPDSMSLRVDVDAPLYGDSSLSLWPSEGKRNASMWKVAVRAIDNESRLSCYRFQLDTMGIVEIQDSSWALPALADGTHRLRAWVRDEAGNISAARESSWVVDTRPPRLLAAKLVAMGESGPRWRLTFTESLGEAARASVEGGEVLLEKEDSTSYLADWNMRTALPLRGKWTLEAYADAYGNRGKDTVLDFSFVRDSLWRQASLWQSHGKLELAQQQYRLYLKEWPGALRVREALANAYRSSGDSAAEEEEWEMLAGRLPWVDSLFQRLRELARQRGDSAAEAKALEASMAIQKKWGASELGGYTQSPRPIHALQMPDLQAVPDSLPSELRLLASVARRHAAEGDWAQARSEYLKALQVHKHAYLLHDLMLCELRLGRADYVRRHLDSLEKPLSSDLASLQALALGMGGDMAKALAIYPAKEDGEEEVRAANRAALLALNGKPRESLPYYLYATSMPSPSLETRIGLGYAYMEAGAMDSAELVWLALGDSVAYRHPEIDHGLALCALQRSPGNDIPLPLQRALRHRPCYVDALLSLGKWYEDHMQPEMARNAYRLASVMQPRQTEARQALARLMLKKGMTAEAKREAALALKENSGVVQKDETLPKAAVLRFVNNTGKPDLDWISIGASEAMSADMLRYSPYTMVERLQVESALQRMGLEQVEEKSAYAKALSGLLGAGALILGSYQGDVKSLRLDARIVEVATGKILATGTASGDLEHLSAMERELALSLAGLSSKQEYSRLADLVSWSAQQKLAYAYDYRYKGNSAKAKELSTEALTMDPHVLSVIDEAVFVDEEDAKGKTLAVLPFVNMSEKKEQQWLSAGVQEALIADLRNIGELSMVDRAQVDKALDEMALGQTGLVDVKSAPRLGKMLAAGVAIMGAYQVVGTQIRINARLVDMETGEVHLATDVQGDVGEVLKLEEKLSFKILEALQINVRNYEQRQAKAMDSTSWKALQMEINQEIQEKERQKSLAQMESGSQGIAARALWIGALTSTALAGGIGYTHWQDRNEYEQAGTPALATRAGDRAESSYSQLLVAGGVAAVAWTATAAWYVWQKCFKDEAGEDKK